MAAAAILMSGLGVAIADTIIVKPEDQKVYREYVHKNPIASIKLPGIELNVGTNLTTRWSCARCRTSITATPSLKGERCWLTPTPIRSSRCMTLIDRCGRETEFAATEKARRCDDGGL